MSTDKCGANLTSERGKIRASTEPMEDCYWYIYPPPDVRLVLTFTRFNMPTNTSENGTCDISYVEILTGKDMVRNSP